MKPESTNTKHPVWRTPAFTSLCVFAALAPLFFYPAGAQSASAKASAIEAGRKQFESSCSFCHGPEATGGRGPGLVRSKLVADDVGGNLIGEVIRDGRPQEGMPAFTMTSEQIQDIAAFLHSRVLAAMNSRTMGSGAYPLSRLLTGNREKGKAFFNGAGRCSACHSPTGDLAHIAKKYEPLQLELQMLYPRGVSSTVTVMLPSGKTIEGTLVHLDEFNVALRDASGWHRSFPRSQVRVKVHDPLAAHRALLGKLTQDEMHNLFAYLETLK